MAACVLAFGCPSTLVGALHAARTEASRPKTFSPLCIVPLSARLMPRIKVFGEQQVRGTLETRLLGVLSEWHRLGPHSLLQNLCQNPVGKV